MAPQSGPSRPPVVAAAPQQRVVELECCGDTGARAAQEGAPPPAAHGVAGCSSSDAPPQTEPRGSLDSEGPHSWVRGESLGTPENVVEHASNKFMYLVRYLQTFNTDMLFV